jgi:hypothetical protein
LTPATLVSPGFGGAEASSFTSLCRVQQSVLEESAHRKPKAAQQALQSEVKEEPQRFRVAAGDTSGARTDAQPKR